MKKAFIIFLLIILAAPISMKAKSTDSTQIVLRNFVMAIIKKDERLAKRLVIPSVKIPEIRENTPIQGVQTLPSHHKNARILLAHFEREYFNNNTFAERIAFIWEVYVENNKISRIKVISDLSNPFMNEPIKEYQEKFNKQLLVPAYFPFKVTHVQGNVIYNEAIWFYRNKNGKLSIQATPHSEKLGALEEYHALTLRNGQEAFMKDIPAGYQVTFLYDDIQYTVKLEGERKLYQPLEKELIDVVESMFPNS
ncbi:hypothetical protein BIV60_27450 [Bacillus sp. MUM 116]|uniref:hypothetical protein n=1 Tax=Bacillus sp. MUM 116 TaxID=1678002 RepID=UPI0008F5AC8A|nr:hypothetical protein [Bacillus sp. MUM 116]OIK06061.1 hypothetical protein BIV60_27450 [Bacillus sp. MUM 116]